MIVFSIAASIRDTILYAFRGANVPSMDVQQALKRVVKAATVVGGVCRGLHEAAKVLDKYVVLLHL